ncbi:MAG: hypothetical protein AB4372_22540 [Xenococcus sp. (in: cyanobacteria)]
MKNLSYIGATLAIIGFGLLPANAVEKEINNNTTVANSTEQVQQSIQPAAYCPIAPYCYIFDCCPS